MTDTNWIPGLIVLAVGLALGLFLAFRLRQSSASRREREGSTDVQLKLKDLEARRDDLYRRIRAAEEEGLGRDEISALEQAAAITLREIDRIAGQESLSGEAIKGTAAPAAGSSPAAGPERRSNPFFKGLAYGAALVLVCAALVYWAVRDAEPKPAGGPAPMAGGSAQAPHEGQPLPAELASQVASLEARIAQDPEDWQAHRELAITLVAGGQFMEAFEEASLVLQQFPEDADALLVHGVVRLTMGQAEQAIDLLDRVLAQNPSQRQALIYRGLSFYQLGRVEQAMDTWEMGLQMTGGSDPEFEELLMMARSGPPPGSSPLPADHPALSAASPATGDVAFEADPAAYPLRVELAAGTRAASQATLFVYLRPQGGGPPVAVRRVTPVVFPVQINLGAQDSMMGSELPDTGTLVARLDADGNVATDDASDLEAAAEASRGELVRLVLGQ